MIKGGRDSGSILHNSTVAFHTHQYLTMPMSAHSIHNPSRCRIRSITCDTFRDHFNSRRWPISRDHCKSSLLSCDPQILTGVTGGEVSWKPVGTSWVHCRLWIIFPPMYPPITSGVHLECNLNMCPACIHQ